jgi:hypothetical protein
LLLPTYYDHLVTGFDENLIIRRQGAEAKSRRTRDRENNNAEGEWKQEIAIMNQSGFGRREWQNSEHICAFVDVDDERHLGHAVKMDQWHAYDATHCDEASAGITYLGAFERLADAKMTIETSVSQRGRASVFGAAS